MRNNYLKAEKAVVDVDNRFTAYNTTFLIPEDNEEYKVRMRYDEEEEYRNSSNMDSIHVVLGRDYKLYFYDENWDAVKGIQVEK